jgi:hypothetical protein
MILTAMVLTVCGHWYGAGSLFLLSIPWYLLGVTLVRSLQRHPPGPVYNRFLALAALQLILFATSVTIAIAV